MLDDIIDELTLRVLMTQQRLENTILVMMAQRIAKDFGGTVAEMTSEKTLMDRTMKTGWIIKVNQILGRCRLEYFM